VKSTGNANRASYAAPVRVAPTNFFIKPGDKDLDALMADVGEGLVITDLAGLHAGANPTSGDFSLLSKGYTIQDGKRGRAVEQITVAGNFYAMLKAIKVVGSDLEFPGDGIGSPSVDVGTLKVSG
jgi:PmbA protein